MENEITAAEVLDYRTAEGISYSSLSRLADSPSAYLEKPTLEGDFLDNGSAVDVLLTEGEEAFHKQFYVMTANKPTSDMMLRYTLEMIDSDNPQLAFAASGYKKAVSQDKWEAEGKPYYDAVKAAGDRVVLDFEQYEKIQATVNQLKANPYTEHYFKAPKDGVEIHYQWEYYWEMPYVNEDLGKSLSKKAKMKADILIIDHNRKMIAVKDLKTTSKPTSAFLSSYRSYRYYLQEALYQEGLTHYAGEHFPDYEVLDFEFIVAQMGAYSNPLIFSVNVSEHGHNFYGGVTRSGYPIKGVAQLMCDLDYYLSTNKWEYEREVVENNGRVSIELFAKEE